MPRLFFLVNSQIRFMPSLCYEIYAYSGNKGVKFSLLTLLTPPLTPAVEIRGSIWPLFNFP